MTTTKFNSRLGAGLLALAASPLALAAGGHDHGHIALFFADQGAGNGAGDVDQAKLQIGLVLADDLVGHRGAGVFIFQLNRGTKHNAATGIQGGGVDDLRGRELALHLHDAAFDKALAVFGGLVFGVFAQIALGTGLGDGGDHGGTLHGFQALQFFFELFSATLGNGQGCHNEFLHKLNAQKQTAAQTIDAAVFSGIGGYYAPFIAFLVR